jgi:flagellar biosynthesis/type III secretory pathway chaperone
MNSQTEYCLVDELLTILEQLIAVYKDIEVFDKEKQRVLVSGKVSDLQRIVLKEKERIDCIATLEERRIALQNVIPGSHTSLSQLIAVLDEPRKGRAIFLAQELKQLVQSLQVMQDTNSIIIQHVLNFTKHKRNVLFNVSTVPDYGTNNNFVDSKGIFNKTI